MTAVDVAEAPPEPAMRSAAETAASADGKGGSQASSPIAVSLPKIAYVYEFGYRLEAGRIAEVQRRHADLCEQQGPQACRILDLKQSGGEGEYATGSLALAVAAPRARAFGVQLAQVAKGAGGEQIASGITGEDLSKQIVDTEARLRARTVLRDRLMEVLATRKGSVAELVEAERGVAQVNEEIDQARSWLTEMQGRVDFSRVNLSYSSGAPSSGGFLEPIRDALGSVGTVLGTVIAILIVLVTVAIPVGLVIWAVVFAIRRLRSRRLVAATGATEATELPVAHSG